MLIRLNDQTHELPAGATVADAVRLLDVQGAYAVAVNLNFVPRAQHDTTPLNDGDRVEIVVPITGG